MKVLGCRGLLALSFSYLAVSRFTHRLPSLQTFGTEKLLRRGDIRSARWLLWGVLVILAFSTTAKAQDPDPPMGIAPYGTYQGGNIDSIGLRNDSLVVDIPMVSYPQRGGALKLDFVLRYKNFGGYANFICISSFCKWTWYPRGPSGFFMVQPNNLSVDTQSYNHVSGGVDHRYSVVSIFDGNGSSHVTADRGGGSFETLDATGINYNNSTKIITDSQGIRYEPCPQCGTTTRQDPNGNKITYSDTSGWTDTMGRLIPQPTDTSDYTGCSGSRPVNLAKIWNFPGPNGGLYPVKLCYVDVASTFGWGEGSAPVVRSQVQSAVLPNGTKWTFEYTSDGNGDLAQITFPTGGTLSYTWFPPDQRQGYCASPNTRTADRPVVTRTLNANEGTPTATWRYSPSCDQTASPFTVNTVTDPLGNDSVYTFGQGNYETQRQIYQGGRSTGTLLKTVKTDYSFYTVPAGAPDHISRINVVPIRVTTIWPTGQQSKIETDYDSGFVFTHPDPLITGTHPGRFGKVLAVRRFDYGLNAPGGMLQQSAPTYQWQVNSTYLNAHLLDLPASVITRDGAGSQAARLDFAYDDPARLIASGITTQHGPAPQAVRGNLTSTSTWLNTTGGSITSFTDWFDTGMVSRQIDPLGHASTFSYSSTFAGAYLTQTQLPSTSSPDPASHIISRNYDFNSGLLTSATDENGQTSNYAYDSMFRPTSATFPDGGATNFFYPDAVTVEQKQKIDATRWTDLLVRFDGLGRTSRTARANGEPSPALPWDQVDTCYDALGRTAFQTYPYRDNGLSVAKACTNSARAGDSFTYDALGRTTQVTRTDGGTAVTSYPGNQTIVTDEAGKKRKSQADALGRLTSVWEPNAAGNFIFETAYQYDTLDNLKRVDQKGNDLNSANWRTRTFVHDSLSRLTSASNPESGTITYQYDNDGNLVSKTDARGITINYSPNDSPIDALHRIRKKTYTNSEPAVSYFYDQTSFNGLAIANGKGRRTGIQDSSGQAAWSYDLMGRAKNLRQTILGITKAIAYDYNPAGLPISITYPSGRRIDYSYNLATRQVSAVDSANAVNYALNGKYTAHGALASALFGNDSGNGGTTLTQTFNSRLQPLNIRAANSTRTLLDLTYNFNLGVNDNGNVAAVTNNRASARNQSFTYDELNRVKTAQSGTLWCNTFNYDVWGNLLQKVLTCGTGESLTVSVDPATNRIVGNAYDAAGNLTSDGINSYTYNAENNLATGAGITFTYDGDGRRVAKSGYRLYWQGMGGSGPLAETFFSGGNKREYIYFAGRRIAMVDLAVSGNNCQGMPPNCARYYFYPDRLGSTSVLASTSGGTTVHEADFYPFGGECIITSSSIDPHYRFTGEERDSETGLDDFGARYFGSRLGRFMSPDEPFIDQSEYDPQSWNLYAYTLNNPLRYTDPDGQAHLDIQGFWVGDEPGECGIQAGVEVCWNGQEQQWEPPPPDGPGSDAVVTAEAEPVETITADVLAPPPLDNGAVSAGFLGPADIFFVRVPNFGILAKIGEWLGLGEKTVVIGKMGDLEAKGAIKSGERALADNLPKLGSPKANWAQNASKLREVMARGKPIRDASARNPTSNTGFLRAERNLLRNHGWTQRGDYWYPPGK